MAQAAEASVSHLRTQRGEHEVDLIVGRDDGRVVAVEVKLKGVVGAIEIVGPTHQQVWCQA